MWEMIPHNKSQARIWFDQVWHENERKEGQSMNEFTRKKGEVHHVSSSNSNGGQKGWLIISYGTRINIQHPASFECVIENVVWCVVTSPNTSCSVFLSFSLSCLFLFCFVSFRFVSIFVLNGQYTTWSPL